MDDRRGQPRVAVSIGVKRLIGSRAQVCQAGNISIGGMLLAQPFEGYLQEPKCWLVFSLAGGKTLIARAQVMRQQRQDRYLVAGVQFATIAPSHRREIAAFIESDAGADGVAEGHEHPERVRAAFLRDARMT